MNEEGKPKRKAMKERAPRKERGREKEGRECAGERKRKIGNKRGKGGEEKEKKVEKETVGNAKENAEEESPYEAEFLFKLLEMRTSIGQRSLSLSPLFFSKFSFFFLPLIFSLFSTKNGKEKLDFNPNRLPNESRRR